MSNNLIKIIIAGVAFIILTASGVLIYNYHNNHTPIVSTLTESEKNDLYQAILTGDSTSYGKYVNNGAALSFAFSDHTTPLEKIILTNDLGSAQSIMESGFDLSKVENNHMDTISNIIVYNKDHNNPTVNEIAITLIDQVQDEITQPDQYGYSLLINTIDSDNVTIMNEILKYVDNVDTVYHDETALTYACSVNLSDTTILDTLVEKGANINFQGDEGYTCLMNAIYSNNLDLIDYLLTLDALNVNIQNDFGQTAYHLCVEYSNLDGLDKILQNSNKDLSIKDNDEYTAKEYAEYLNMTEFVNKF